MRGDSIPSKTSQVAKATRGSARAVGGGIRLAFSALPLYVQILTYVTIAIVILFTPLEMYDIFFTGVVFAGITLLNGGALILDWIGLVLVQGIEGGLNWLGDTLEGLWDPIPLLTNIDIPDADFPEPDSVGRIEYVPVDLFQSDTTLWKLIMDALQLDDPLPY